MHRAAVAAKRCTCSSHTHTYTHTFARIYSAKYTESHTHIRSVYIRTGCSETARHLKATRVPPRHSLNLTFLRVDQTAEHNGHPKYCSRKRYVHLNEHLNGTIGSRQKRKVSQRLLLEDVAFQRCSHISSLDAPPRESFGPSRREAVYLTLHDPFTLSQT